MFAKMNNKVANDDDSRDVVVVIVAHVAGSKWRHDGSGGEHISTFPGPGAHICGRVGSLSHKQDKVITTDGNFSQEFQIGETMLGK